MSALRLGTRASKLALAQSQAVAEAITSTSGRVVELVEITTRGDVSQDPLARIGGTGVFVNALREALLAGTVDLAVHSLKDLPTAPARGLVVAAIPTRQDPRDVVCARDGLTLGELPEGSLVGTGAPRRAAQIKALGMGLKIVDVRGNVDTRLAKVANGDLDAVILARAGLARLGRLDDVTETLDPIQVLPAPGQGALAVECRNNDTELIDLLAVLDDRTTRSAVTAERTLLAALEAGCSAPVGAYAEAAEGDEGLELYLRAVVVSPDGAVSIRKSATGPLDAAEQLGRDLAAELLADGAGAVVDARDRAPKEETVP
ncbi:MAG TPA: hydroxymethylbilane synthase [Jiangellaceae bacterium]|nr:hydroxymethylbilane synthase [Jiangellaceae bacterium]